MIHFFIDSGAKVSNPEIQAPLTSVKCLPQISVLLTYSYVP